MERPHTAITMQTSMRLSTEESSQSTLRYQLINPKFCIYYSSMGRLW